MTSRAVNFLDILVVAAMFKYQRRIRSVETACKLQFDRYSFHPPLMTPSPAQTENIPRSDVSVSGTKAVILSPEVSRGQTSFLVARTGLIASSERTNITHLANALRTIWPAQMPFKAS